MQLLYPWDRAFVGAHVDGVSFTFKTKDEIATRLTERYRAATIEVKDLALKRSFREAGIDPDEQTAARVAVDWPWWQRLIPFSSIYRGFTINHQTPLKQNSAAQSSWAQLVLAECNKPAVNASVTVSEQSTIQVKPSSDGRACEVKTILSQLSRTQLATKMIVDPKSTTITPKRTNAQVESVLTTLRPILERGISVKANENVTTADAKTIAPWLVFSDGDKGALVVDVDLAKMQEFIDRAQSTVYIAPGTTYIQKVDGAETARTIGTNGQGIDQKKLAESIRTIFKTQQNKQLDATVVALPPKEVVDNSYTNTSTGLQALLNQLAKDNGDVAIAVAELGGQGRSLSVNGAKQYHPASTYKLVIAYGVIKRLESGNWQWSEQVAGKSVDDCLTAMIVDSDNSCAEEFGERISWSGVQSDVRSLGMNNTNYQAADFVSTVSDQALFLTKLEREQLMKPENRDKLLSLMKRQRFRAGIPAGVNAPVADKVGFLGGLLHDSAIVYSPGGTYVIVVYSRGGSWNTIASIASEIDGLIR